MNDNSTTLERVIQAIGRALNREVTTLHAHTLLIQDLNVESIDFLDIGFELEQSLGREISFKSIVTRTRQRDVRISDIVSYFDSGETL